MEFVVNPQGQFEEGSYRCFVCKIENFPDQRNYQRASAQIIVYDYYQYYSEHICETCHGVAMTQLYSHYKLCKTKA